MFRGLVLAVVVLVTPHVGVVQSLSVLHIKVAIVDSNRQSIPVPRHRLQISDNPATGLPRRVITSLEGTVDVRLPAGNYTVESERPVALEGKSYQWAVVVDIVAGRDAVLELTANNAEVGVATDAPDPAIAPVEVDPSSLLARWQDSLVAIWTATAHGSGFLVDSNGLIAADLRVIGAATSVEVQLSPSLKVAGTVVASDVMRGIALVSINPSIALSARPLPLECDRAPEPLAVRQEITALQAPLGRPRGAITGFIESVLPNAVDSGLTLSADASGGPVFALNGRLIGLTTLVPEREGQWSGRTRIVRIGRVCEFIASAAEKIRNTPPPPATNLPVEPLRPFPSDPAAAGTTGRAGNPSLYRMSSSNFDIVVITPVQLMASNAATNFSTWSEYVAATPPVLLIRVTPKLAEGFWTRIARGAAMTQGVAIPPLKRPKSGFARMRALCGDVEIVPVHPFNLEHRLSDKDTLVEGLYAFDPGALTPACATVTLQLFSEKEPRKADTLVVDAKVIQQIWQDFAPHRALNR